MADVLTQQPFRGSESVFRSGWFVAGSLASALVLLLVFYDSLASLANTWWSDENYGHGLFVPFIALYLAWEKKDRIRGCDGQGAWLGFLVIVGGMALFLAGQLATLFVVQHFAFWVVIVGLVMAALGLRGAKILAFPLGLLLATIPLPQFLFQGLSTHLRSISSTLGVTCLQIVGITAFQDGNVIDLGPIQLQVVEACSGLRFLFPLMTLALLCAYFLHDRMWKRIFLFLSSIPIAILLNGFRIGMIGVLVEYWGKGAADGFIHLFEGWIVFLAGVGLLVGEMWLLKRLWPRHQQASSDSTRNKEKASVETPEGSMAKEGKPQEPERPRSVSSSPWAFISGLIIVGSLGLLTTQLEAREERTVPRQTFVDFPLQLGSWEGIARPLEQVYIDALRFEDYLLADFHRQDDPHSPINLYVAYYQSQRSGQAIHSPQSCIPGDGWLITSVETIPLDPPSPGMEPFFVNEVIIEKGDVQQVVWYWFQQRQRNLTNEYLLKWYLVWDALTQGRTDGALIRFTTPIPSHGDLTLAKARLEEFSQLVHARLDSYVPR